MDVLSRLRMPIGQEMTQFEALFSLQLEHDNPLLATALVHLSKRKGKLMRPILVLLAAKAFGTVDSTVLHAAVSLEMLHTASLVHDDVVDESERRRGQQSVNSLLDNKAAVLVGDYLLSLALQHAALTANIRAVEVVAGLGKELSIGELQQLAILQSDEIGEAQYLDVISNKTASLFSACAYIGALLGGATEQQSRLLRDFGVAVGQCFQIRDDVFDYFDAEVGKPTGNDMKEGKLTLPAIYAVTQPGAEQWHEVAMRVRRGEASASEIASLVDYTKQAGGIDYAMRRMDEIRSHALQMLDGAGMEPAIAESLRLYLDFVVRRIC